MRTWSWPVIPGEAGAWESTNRQRVGPAQGILHSLLHWSCPAFCLGGEELRLVGAGAGQSQDLRAELALAEEGHRAVRCFDPVGGGEQANGAGGIGQRQRQRRQPVQGGNYPAHLLAPPRQFQALPGGGSQRLQVAPCIG